MYENEAAQEKIFWNLKAKTKKGCVKKQSSIQNRFRDKMKTFCEKVCEMIFQMSS